MSAVLRAELLKQRSTTTAVGLLLAMVALVSFAVVLHGFGLPVNAVDRRSEQLTMLFGWGEILGALFAGLLGAMSITSEIRYGTIRPTFIVTPQRGRVIAAKVGASLLTGLVFGLVAGTLAAAIGSATLAARGLQNLLDGGDLALLIAGSSAAAALSAALGVGIGAVVRNQVTTIAGICAWLLLVENLLVAYVADAGRLGPGAAGKALAGLDPDTLLAPGIGALVLALYAAAGAVAGSRVAIGRDVD